MGYTKCVETKRDNTLIIGDGDIASVLKDREGALFFACGVSNSKNTDLREFKREKDLLLECPKSLCLFYFSTISIFYKESLYTNHKKRMELLIKSNFNNYNIIRIGNISWGKNPNTFLNYLRAKANANEPYEFLDEYRYLVSEEDLLLLTDNLPLKGQNEICIFGKMAKPKDLI